MKIISVTGRRIALLYRALLFFVCSFAGRPTLDLSDYPPIIIMQE